MHPLEASQGTGNPALKKDFSIKQKIPNLTTLLSSPVKPILSFFKLAKLFILPFYIKTSSYAINLFLNSVGRTKFCKVKPILPLSAIIKSSMCVYI